MHNKNLLILGAGGFGQSIAELATLLNKWGTISFVDDRWPNQTQVARHSIIANIQNLTSLDLQNYEAIIAIGNNQIRQKWHQLLLDLDVSLTSIIHPQAIIAPSAKIGSNVIIMAGCIVGTNSVIQDGVILNIGALLDHDVMIESFSHLSVGVKVAGGNIVSSYSFFEVGHFIAHKS